MDFQSDNELYPSGMIIADNYEIVNHLASGGMAHVYIALQNKLGRRVALKVLNSTCCANHSVVTRFVNEARIVAQLHHPHIVEVYDVGETEDHRSFMAMELLEGRSLGDRIKEGAMSPGESYPIVRQVAESLAEAHSKGVIHRDLKPDNIFLTLKSGVKTLDFGIAKVLHSDSMEKSEEKLTRAGTAPGTPEYMSPEQARGQALDARSDLYSLGIVLYEMLAGHPPFEEPTFLATILKQVQSPPPPLPATVPVPLANYVVNRLLSKDPNCRPENANAMIAELDDLAIKLNIKTDEAAQGQSLIIALSEIEQLKLQLAATQQELQRSRDMACLDIEDLQKGSDGGAAPAGQGLSISVPGAGTGAAPSLSVNLAGLTNLQPAAVNKQSFIDQRNPGDSSMSMNVNKLSAENPGMNANVPVPPAPPARNSSMTQAARRPAPAGQPSSAQQMQNGVGGQASVAGAYSANVPGSVSNDSVPPPRNAAMAQNAAYQRAAAPVRNVAAPSGMPANGVPAPNRGTAMPNNGVMQNGPVMPNRGASMPNNGMMQNGPVMPNRGTSMPNNGMMQNGPVMPGRGTSMPNNGMMQNGPVMPGRGASMPNNGMMQNGPVMPGRGANMPNMGGNADYSNYGAPSRNMYASYDEPNDLSRPAHAANRSMPSQPTNSMASRRPMPATPGRGPARNVSSEISSQNPRISREQDIERQNRASSQSGMRQAPQNKPMQDVSSSFGASDMVMSEHSYEVMRSLEISNQEAGRAAAVESRIDPPRNNVDDEEIWQPRNEDFYGSGVLKDEESSSYDERADWARNEPEMRQRQPISQRRDSFYDDDEDNIVAPQPRFSSPQPTGHQSQDMASGRRKQPVSDASRVAARRSDSYSRMEDVTEKSFRSQPQDVLTGRASAKTGRGRTSGAAQEKFMQFSQPLMQIFGPAKVEAMLHFSQGIWNAAIMGASAICELKDGVRDNAAMLKLVDGMIGRKLKMFDSDKWLIDELNVSVDDSGRMSLDFVQIESE